MAHHGAALRAATKDPSLAGQLSHDWRKADLTPKLRAMLEYAAKLTRTPADVRKDDVELLREMGFDEREILDVAQVVAYFNFVNRMADGLGVELEEG